MLTLPNSSELPIAKLASAFSNTSATYKFYWLLAIIESVEQGEQHIPKRKLFARMIANAWYTVNYFKVSFGRQDLIQEAVKKILETERLTIDIKKSDLIKKLEISQNQITSQCLNHFNLNVPHWFLSPWFSKAGLQNDSQYKKYIYNASQNFENNCLYALYDTHIEVNVIWVEYIKQNARVLKDFCDWNLCLFLQVRNPNVPDIPNKIIQPSLRSSLTKQRNEYWNIVFKERPVSCIFTDKPLELKSYALDHFVPHAFVSHDLMWNLIPIDPIFNCKKSDKLPSIEKHFDKFFDLQKEAYQIVKSNNSRSKFLEEYLTIFPVLDSADDFAYQRYKENIQPLVSIAGNNGFKTFI